MVESWLNLYNMEANSTVPDENQTDFDAVTLRLFTLEKEFHEHQNEFQQLIIMNRSLKKEIHQLTCEYESVLDEIYNLQLNVTSNNQYTRRENIEFINIPERIKQSELEKTVIKILKCIDVEVTSYKIVAVHRLGKPRQGVTRNVIVRFINRKDAISSLINKKKLPKAKSIANDFNRIFIIENLCLDNKRIFDKCYKLKSDNIIKRLWSFNGVVNIKFSDSRDEWPTKIYHFSDIDYYIHENSYLSSSLSSN